MSNLQELVPSKDICEQLAAAGFPQNASIFCWRGLIENRIIKWNIVKNKPKGFKLQYSAPLASEILDKLPHNFLAEYDIYRTASGGYGIVLDDVDQTAITVPNFVSMCAEMYLYLKTNKLI